MHPAIIIGTVRSLWTWLWGRYHVPQNIFLVSFIFNSQVLMLENNKIGAFLGRFAGVRGRALLTTRVNASDIDATLYLQCDISY